MNFPSSRHVQTYDSSFEVAHSEARAKNFSGSLAIREGVKEAAVVYYEGCPVYANFERGDFFYGHEALEKLDSVQGSIDRHEAEPDEVEMFRTYMRYIGRERGEVNVYKTGEAKLPERTVLLTRQGEFKKETVPAGRRIGKTVKEEYVGYYAEENDFNGYCLSNDAVVYFEDGERVRSEKFKDDGLSLVVRIDSSEEADRLENRFVDIHVQGDVKEDTIDVELDIHGVEVVETGGSEDGLLGRFI